MTDSEEIHMDAIQGDSVSPMSNDKKCPTCGAWVDKLFGKQGKQPGHAINSMQEECQSLSDEVGKLKDEVKRLKGEVNHLMVDYVADDVGIRELVSQVLSEAVVHGDINSDHTPPIRDLVEIVVTKVVRLKAEVARLKEATTLVHKKLFKTKTEVEKLRQACGEGADEIERLQTKADQLMDEYVRNDLVSRNLFNRVLVEDVVVDTSIRDMIAIVVTKVERLKAEVKGYKNALEGDGQ